MGRITKIGKSPLSNTDSFIKYIQVNLRHTKIACINLINYMVENKILVALIQEPWVSNCKIMGLNHKDFCLYNKSIEDSRPRSCVLVHRSLTAFLLSNFSDADTTAIKIECDNYAIVVVSSYFAGDRDVPPSAIAEIMKDISLGPKDGIIVGCDANARCDVWGSSETNKRGEYLLEFINASNLVVCNRGSSPTFRFPAGINSAGWADVIDVTLCGNSKSFGIKDWMVMDVDSFSDHSYITFKSNFLFSSAKSFRNPKNTDWEKFSTLLTSNLEKCRKTVPFNSVSELEHSVGILNKGFSDAFKGSCRVSRGKNRNFRLILAPIC